MNKNVSIIGLGVVGQALCANIHEDIESVTIFDDKPGYLLYEGESKEIDESDVVFVCVDTPMREDGSQDSTNVEMVLKNLIEQDYRGLVILKSTILYNRIKKYMYHLNLVISPEFLRANTSVADFKSTNFLVLGGLAPYTREAEYVMKEFFRYSFDTDDMHIEHCTFQEAIDFKYTRNIHQAYNVLFWEMIQDITGNSRKMAEMLKYLPVGENSDIGQDGYRGYGQSFYKNETFSACLDKDLNAVAFNTQHEVLKALDTYNKKLTQKII